MPTLHNRSGFFVLISAAIALLCLGGVNSKVPDDLDTDEPEVSVGGVEFAEQTLATEVGRLVLELMNDFESMEGDQTAVLRLEIDQHKWENVKTQQRKMTNNWLLRRLVSEAVKVEREAAESGRSFVDSSEWLAEREGLLGGMLQHLIILACCGLVSYRIGQRGSRLNLLFRVTVVYFLVLFLISVPLNFYHLYRAELVKQYATLLRAGEAIARRCLPEAANMYNGAGVQAQVSATWQLWPSLSDILPRWLGWQSEQEAECERFFAAFLNTPRVTPVRAFSFTLWSTAFEPLEPLGEALARFFASFSFLERVLCSLAFLLLAICCCVFTMLHVCKSSNVCRTATTVSQLCCDSDKSVATTTVSTGTGESYSKAERGVRIFDDQDAVHVAYDSHYGQLFARVTRDASSWRVCLARYKPTQLMQVYEMSPDAVLLDETQLDALSGAIPRIRAVLRRCIDRGLTSSVGRFI